MTKFISKILAVSLVLGVFTATTATAKSYDYYELRIENAFGISAETYYQDANGDDIPVYQCEDYAKISLLNNETWISFTYLDYIQGSTSVDVLTEDSEGNPLISVDGWITVDGTDTMSIDDYYAGVIDGSISWDLDIYLHQGTEYNVVYEGIYMAEIVDMNNAYSYAMFEVVDSDGVDSYVEQPKIYTTSTEATATPIQDVFTVNGVEIVCESYEIKGEKYFKLHDLAYILNGTEKQFEVAYNEEYDAINLKTRVNYTEVGNELVIGDGTEKIADLSKNTFCRDEFYANFVVYDIDGQDYFNISDICQAFNIGLTVEDSAIDLDTSVSYIK
ncbi:MAG: hypothetical protein R3Y09_11340 [Clostridia bacterium]